MTVTNFSDTIGRCNQTFSENPLYGAAAPPCGWETRRTNQVQEMQGVHVPTVPLR